MIDRPIPRATYRLQVNKDFTFEDAERLVPYLAELGISHAYLSPILSARPDSTHGYDTIDHTHINPELGSIEEFRSLANALRQHGMSVVLDIVPNHMGIGGDANSLWLDVLEFGQLSPYADWFDIDWQPPEPTLCGRVLVPFLSCSYGEALHEGHLELRFDPSKGTFAVWAEGSHRLPIRPSDYSSVLPTGIAELDPILISLTEGASRDVINDAKRALAFLWNGNLGVRRIIEDAVTELNERKERDRLSSLISLQHWRVARFSVAADEINYRRFFIVSDLAAIRVEREDVFDHVHRLIFQLVGEGLVDGLRMTTSTVFTIQRPIANACARSALIRYT